jgi:hypothetical protein
MTRAKRHLVRSMQDTHVLTDLPLSQCVVGDSSTVQHGGSFLKKWLAWLEANADVRYAGFD